MPDIHDVIGSLREKLLDLSLRVRALETTARSLENMVLNRTDPVSRETEAPPDGNATLF